jgi:two-component system, chemotaxis family, sensor kinase CheA
MGDALNFELEEDEVELFLQEVDEYIQTLETNLLFLEQNADPQVLNAVFRAAHTLKSIAATVGHNRMADLTHALETLFDKMRNTGLSLTSSTIDELLVMVDVLKELRNEVISMEATNIDLPTLLSRLQIITDDEDGDVDQKKTAPIATKQHQLTEEQFNQIQTSREDGLNVMEVEIIPAADAFALAARFIQAERILKELGQVLIQDPTSIDLSQNNHSGQMWVILATQSDADAIKKELSHIQDLAEFRINAYTPVETTAPTDRSPQTSMAKRENGTVRISVERLDTLMNLVGELVTDRTRLYQLENVLQSKTNKDETVDALGEMTAHFSRVVDQLQHEVMQARMLPISHLFTKFPRLVRDLARSSGKQVDLLIEGEETELDRSVIEVIGDPLTHLIRNSVDHGIETPEERQAAGKPPTGTVRITASHKEGYIIVTITDDGPGLDPDLIRKATVKRGLMSEEEVSQLDDDAALSLIFRPNLSTASEVTEISGRGVGLDIVSTNIKKLSGSVIVDSVLGQGATFRITLPLTLAILQTMLVNVGTDVYAIPMTTIINTIYISDVTISSVQGNPVINWRDQVLPLMFLRDFFNHSRAKRQQANNKQEVVVIVSWGKLRVGLVVDSLIGKQEIVIKSLSPILGNVVGLAGCTILGDGNVILIIDIQSVIN